MVPAVSKEQEEELDGSILSFKTPQLEELDIASKKITVLCYSESFSHELTQQAEFFKVDRDNGARLPSEG